MNICTACNCKVPEKGWIQHVEGKKHRKNTPLFEEYHDRYKKEYINETEQELLEFTLNQSILDIQNDQDIKEQSIDEWQAEIRKAYNRDRNKKLKINDI